MTVALFKPYSSTERPAPGPTTPAAKTKTNQPPPVAVADPVVVTTGAQARSKKSIPTPTRRQAEDARRQRIQPVLTKKQSKQKQREAQDEATARMHARPHNVMIRDWVDRRWNVAELMLPIMLILMVGIMFSSLWWPSIMTYGMIVIWALLAGLILDTIIMWQGLRQRLRLYFPHEPIKGKLGYAFSRAMSTRRGRRPPPQVKRGTPFVWPPEHD